MFKEQQVKSLWYQIQESLVKVNTYGSTPVFVSKVIVKQPRSFVYVSSVAAFVLEAELKSCSRDRNPQSQRYLLSGPSQKKFTDSWSRTLF